MLIRMLMANDGDVAVDDDDDTKTALVYSTSAYVMSVFTLRARYNMKRL